VGRTIAANDSRKTFSGRMDVDDALSSTAALNFDEFVAMSADNFAMGRRSGGHEFKIFLHNVN